MMAYRSEQHETMGVIAKCVNAEIDNIRWVWELQERLENAYPFVWNKMNQLMVKQNTFMTKSFNGRRLNLGEK